MLYINGVQKLTPQNKVLENVRLEVVTRRKAYMPKPRSLPQTVIS